MAWVMFYSPKCPFGMANTQIYWVTVSPLLVNLSFLANAIGYHLQKHQRDRGDYGHEKPSRNGSFRRHPRSTSKMKKKRGRSSSRTERSSMMDDSRNQEWFGGRQRSVERGRRRHHQRESPRRRRNQHTSPYGRSSPDRSRRRERRAGFSHGEGSGNLHLRGDREESVGREGSVSEPAAGQGIPYSATHDNNYEQEIYRAPGGFPYDQLIFPYAAAGHYSNPHYSYGTGISDFDHVRNGFVPTTFSSLLERIKF
ncbi:unnamed protein product [Tuber aestivum]|uniref:Uncharacterized protein n=1 Tax=Tuber aestivum TaxID=59557 RepID=A0A292Q0W5_9PEZI|nr:unnamed protein product [Tuber aestivum]